MAKDLKILNSVFKCSCDLLEKSTVTCFHYCLLKFIVNLELLSLKKSQIGERRVGRREVLGNKTSQIILVYCVHIQIDNNNPSIRYNYNVPTTFFLISNCIISSLSLKPFKSFLLLLEYNRKVKIWLKRPCQWFLSW